MNQDELRLPPQAIEAEQSLLGSMMLSESAVDDIRGQIESDDFYKHGHRFIFESILACDSMGVRPDLITVSDHLTEQGKINEAGGMAYLGELAQNTPNSSNVKSYVKIVRERTILRRLIESANEIIQSAYQTNGRTPDDILAEADSMLGSILHKSSALDSSHIRVHLEYAIEGLEARWNSESPIVGAPTGFKDLDSRLLGLEAGELYVVAARPGMGKTAFAMNMAQHNAMNNGALFISLEMPISQLINRLWATYGVEHQSIRRGNLNTEDWPKLTHATDQLNQSELYVDDTPALSVSKITAIVKKRVRKSGKMPVFVDYLQIMDSDNRSENRTQEVTKFIGGLKALAKQLDIPIVVLSQLNRSVENRPDKRPKMADLRETGAIEQDASAVMFLYRDEKYNPKTEFTGYAELILAKNRHGLEGTIPLGWQGEYQRFNNLDEESRARFYHLSQNQVASFPGKGRKLK